MADQQPRYRSYVLRLWEVRSGGQWAWRASLQSPDTGERHAFAQPQALFRFLQGAMEMPTEARRSFDGRDGD